jgi:S1-C subfamily serine protease
VVGSQVYAIGSPKNYSHSVTSGIFSGLRKFNSGGTYYLQTNAQINPGNSGGPLITEDGQVVGINTWKHLEDTEGLGFAITINTAFDEFKRSLGNAISLGSSRETPGR